MSILSWILPGSVVSMPVKRILPGDDPGGLFATIGIAGDFVAGFRPSLLGIATTGGFSFGGIAVATAGALLLSFGYRKMKA